MTIRITVTFPDGSIRELEFDLCKYSDAYGLAEDACREMADEWARFQPRRRRRRSRLAYVEGCLRWMYPALVSAFIEYAQSLGLLPGGGE